VEHGESAMAGGVGRAAPGGLALPQGGKRPGRGEAHVLELAGRRQVGLRPD